GLETMESYGLSVGHLTRGREYVAAARALAQAIPAAHLDFFASLGSSFTIGEYYICHAGVRPGVPLEQQKDKDLLWIREPFLTSRVDFGKIVVHGHTPVANPEVLPNRINVDTGAFMTGRLTCAVLEAGAEPRFMTAMSASSEGGHVQLFEPG